MTYLANEHLTTRGWEWLLIDISNTYGNDSGNGVKTDKLLREEQIAWVILNDNILEELAVNADEITAYRKAVDALRCYQRGEKVCHCAYIDASNQALGLYGVLTACKATGLIANIGTGNVRNDAYTMLADSLNNRFKTTLFTRKNCKKALMTTVYGSLKADLQIISAMYSIDMNKIDKIKSKLKELAGILKADVTNEEWLIDAFNSCMTEIAPNAMRAMDVIQQMNQLGRKTYYWTMPDGFIVKYDVKTDVDVSVNFEFKGRVFKFEETVKNVYQANEHSRGMAPNVIHSIDAWIARELIRDLGAWISTTHDAFGCHLNDLDRLVDIYNDKLILLMNSDILNQILAQIIGDDKPFQHIHRVNTMTEEDIRNSLYSLC